MLESIGKTNESRPITSRAKKFMEQKVIIFDKRDKRLLDILVNFVNWIRMLKVQGFIIR